MFLQLSIQQTGSSSLLFHFSIVTLLLLPKLFLLLWQKLKWQKISVCKCETILPFEGAESIKSYEVHQAVILSLSYPDDKTFLHLQMNIFCHIDFFHSTRKNGFSIRRRSSTRSLQYLMPFFSYGSLVAVATVFTPVDTNQILKCVLNRKSKF